MLQQLIDEVNVGVGHGPASEPGCQLGWLACQLSIIFITLVSTPALPRLLHPVQPTARSRDNSALRPLVLGYPHHQDQLYCLAKPRCRVTSIHCCRECRRRYRGSWPALSYLELAHLKPSNRISSSVLPGEMQGVRWLVEGMTSSFNLVNLGPDLSPTTVAKGRGRRASFPHPHQCIIKCYSLLCSST